MKDAIKRLRAAFGDANMFFGILAETAFVLLLTGAGFLICLLLGLL